MPKTQKKIYRNFLTTMVPTKRGRDYQEKAAVAAAIAAVAAASKPKADAEDVEAVIVDATASIELDDNDVMRPRMVSQQGETMTLAMATSTLATVLAATSATATTKGTAMAMWEGWRGRGLPRSVSLRCVATKCIFILICN